jgi:ribosomal protein S18 acetylase RimI-like enzyme
MQIRPVESIDLGSLVTIFRACWNISYRDLISEAVRDAMDIDAATKLLANAVNPNPGRYTLIATEGESGLGFASFGSDADDESRGHLFSLYVSPESAGKGVGSELLNEVISELDKIGKPEITLWVFKENPTAIGLYRKSGFVETGREKTDERWQIPQIEMLRKAITQ